MSKDDKASVAAAQLLIDDEPDDWDKRIFSTGCADENAKLTDCYYEKKDWRACKQERRKPRCCRAINTNIWLITPQMETFRQCWQRHGNDKRTDSKDA